MNCVSRSKGSWLWPEKEQLMALRRMQCMLLLLSSRRVRRMLAAVCKAPTLHGPLGTHKAAPPNIIAESSTSGNDPFALPHVAAVTPSKQGPHVRGKWGGLKVCVRLHLEVVSVSGYADGDESCWAEDFTWDRCCNSTRYG
eukprot:3065704-Amphidinium_carterae.1